MVIDTDDGGCIHTEALFTNYAQEKMQDCVLHLILLYQNNQRMIKLPQKPLRSGAVITQEEYIVQVK